MATLDVDQLRITLLQASNAAAADQHALFVANGTITLEYALLGNLGDLLAAAAMLTHTIHRAHTEPTVISEFPREFTTATQPARDTTKQGQWRHDVGLTT